MLLVQNFSLSLLKLINIAKDEGLSCYGRDYHTELLSCTITASCGTVSYLTCVTNGQKVELSSQAMEEVKLCEVAV